MKLHALSIAAALTLAVATPRADILEQILVKVNGDIITKSDLEQRQVAMIRQRQPNQRPSNDAELQKALSEITPEVIVDFVDELLMVQRGRESASASAPSSSTTSSRTSRRKTRSRRKSSFRRR